MGIEEKSSACVLSGIRESRVAILLYWGNT